MCDVLSRVYDLLFPFNCQFTTRPVPIVLTRTALPELPLEIWLEIFQFATHVHQFGSLQPLNPFAIRHITTNAMGPNSPSLALRTKLALVSVSRSWRQVALQILYQHFVIRGPSRARVLLSVLNDSATDGSIGYGRWTRHIEISTYTRGSEDLRYLQTVFKIFCRCPNLRILSGVWIHPLPVEFLQALSSLYGNTLSGLYWNERGPTISPDYFTKATPEFLASFDYLRCLDLRHFIGSDPSKRTSSTPRPTLPRVEELILSTHPRSLTHAAILQMPALCKLTLRTPSYNHYAEELLIAFLEEHGKSLVIVDLPAPSFDSDIDSELSPSRNNASHVNPDIFLKPKRCPNLQSLVFPVSSPPLAPHEHPNLRKIGLRGIRLDGLYPDKTSATKNHLIAISVDKFPNLELIQTPGFLVEAETDSLAKDVFIWWVERFEKQGVDFLDGEGVLWAYTDPIDGPEQNSNGPQPVKLSPKEPSEAEEKKEDAKPMDS